MTTSLHVAVIAGEGILAKVGPALLVMLPGGAEQVRDELLTAFEQACADQETPGRTMARRLVGLMSKAEPDDLPSFGACAPNERGWAVILHQAVALHLDDGDQTVLSGYDASTWVDRIVAQDFNSMTLLPDGQTPPAVDGRFRFDGGVIPAAGATIVPVAMVPAAQPVPAPGSGTAVPTTPDAAAEPEPVTVPDAPAASVEPDQPAASDQPVKADLPAASAAPPAADLDTADPGSDDAGAVPPTGPAVADPTVLTPTTPPPPVEASGIGEFEQAPTPTADPSQQAGWDATEASRDLPVREVPDAPQPVVAEVEDEPPTLIQPPSRDTGDPTTVQTTEPEALPEEDVAFESVSLVDIPESARRDPLPVLGEDASKDDLNEDGAPLVYGVVSPSGYFNHPDALYCAVTGVAMLHRTHVLVERPRPPLGVVVADDGSTFTLNANYIVGREPERDPSVESDDARPLKLQDAERSLSRVHAEIRLEDWDVFVVDRGSANGTYVLPRGAQQWKRLVADSSEKIVPGTRVAFGKRVVTYESHHQINQAAAS